MCLCFSVNMAVLVAEFLKSHVLLLVDLLANRSSVCSCHKDLQERGKPFSLRSHWKQAGSWAYHASVLCLEKAIHPRIYRLAWRINRKWSSQRALGILLLAILTSAGMVTTPWLHTDSHLPSQKAEQQWSLLKESINYSFMESIHFPYL